MTGCILRLARSARMASASYPFSARNAVGFRSGKAMSVSLALQLAASPTVRWKGAVDFVHQPDSEALRQAQESLTGDPASRAAKSASTSLPFSARCRDKGANRGAIDTVMAAVRPNLGQGDRYCLPDNGFAPAPEPAVNRVPVTVFGRNVTPSSTVTKPPEYPIDDGSVRFGAATTPPVHRINRQQTLQITSFCFTQITPAQTCLQKAALNQPDRVTSINLSTPPSLEIFA